MKKIALLVILGLLIFSGNVFADWSVTVTWTRSVGPNLDYEECLSADIVKCTVQETEVTSCNWTQASLAGEEVKIKSVNNQGAFSEYVIGNLSSVPAPATGGAIIIQYVP